MPKIFINYRRDDEPATARLLHRDLCERFGEENVFFDAESIEAGGATPGSAEAGASCTGGGIGLPRASNGSGGNSENRSRNGNGGGKPRTRSNGSTGGPNRKARRAHLQSGTA